MKIKFKDKEDQIWFEYVDTPEKLPLKKRGKVNLTGLYLYGMYRNTLYDSYKEKINLAEDIKVYPKVFDEHPSKLDDTLYKDPLYHYSVAGCLAATNEWLNQEERIKSYVACELVKNHKNAGYHKRIVGIVHFVEKQIDDENFVYIAQAAVAHRSAGIGKRLMECVLSHYPENTHFKILTRVFNDNAQKLYHEKLHFSPIEIEAIKQLGYDERYCGFEHTTSSTEIQLINENKVLVDHIAIEESEPRQTNSFK